MLTRLLCLLATSHRAGVASLARELGVSTTLVEMMLEDLARRRLLQTACPATCHGCPLWVSQESCPVGLWVLTPQGEQRARSIEEHDLQHGAAIAAGVTTAGYGAAPHVP